jgi:adenine/guanine/hypoxanthine permease
MRSEQMEKSEFKYPLFVKTDFDGFVGLFIDNLVNLLLITFLCKGISMPDYIIYGSILPATALSVLAGNFFYSYLAKKLAYKEKRKDVTALPYGINTVSLLAFFLLIIVPVYIQTKDAKIAWQVGVISALISGIFEGAGALIGDKIRRITPRAALLSTLSGIAIVFIALEHTYKLWDNPYVAFIPLALILFEYFSHEKLPFKIPAGVYALIIGSIIAWSLGYKNSIELAKSTENVGFHLPGFALFDIFTTISFSQIGPYLSIAIPMGIMSFFGTLQNVESASAAGDEYSATPVLAMNGIGTIIGSIFGSPFPTTVYIGHPGWKALGARAGYSIINGFVITIICFTGLMSMVNAFIPIEAGYPILLWIGVVITAQAFQTTPKEHAPAVAIGLLPGIAAWGVMIISKYISTQGTYSPMEMNNMISSAIGLEGLLPFSQGALLTAMFLSAIAVYIIEKDFLKSFLWTIPLIILSFFGFINASEIKILPAFNITVGYALLGATFLLIYFYKKFSDE